MDDKLIGSINQLLSPMFDTFFSNSNKLGHDINQICPTCGQTRREWEESRRLNCKDCVQFLDSDEIHNGKIPKNNKEELYVINLIKEKEGHLKKLIAEEKYEEAAKIRDEIKDLKGDFLDDKQTS
jgi:protein arginine kinase activator